MKKVMFSRLDRGNNTPTNASKLPYQLNPKSMAEILIQDIESDVRLFGGASMAAIGTTYNLESNENIAMLAMLVAVTGKYDIYQTDDGYFHDFDFIVVPKGKLDDAVFDKIGMKKPSSLTML